MPDPGPEPAGERGCAGAPEEANTGSRAALGEVETLVETEPGKLGEARGGQAGLTERIEPEGERSRRT